MERHISKCNRKTHHSNQAYPTSSPKTVVERIGKGVKAAEEIKRAWFAVSVEIRKDDGVVAVLLALITRDAS
jgi:hypothetical protein